MVIDPEQWELEYQQRNNQPILMTDFWSRAIKDLLPKELRLKNIHLDYLLTTYSKGYVKKAQKADLLKKVLEAINKDRKYEGYVYNRTLKIVNDFEEFAKKLEMQSSAHPKPKQLLPLWEAFDKEFLKVVPWFYIPWYLTEENYLAERVKVGLEKYKDGIEKITDFNSALMVLLFPTKESMFQQEQVFYNKLVTLANKLKKFEDNKVFIKQAHEYLKKYSWMTTYFILPMDKLDYKKLVAKIKKDKLQQLPKLENAKVKTSLQKLLFKDKSLLKDIKVAQDYAWLLTWSVEQLLYSAARLIPFYKLIAKQIGVPYKKFVLFTSEEIKQALNGKLNNFNLDDRELAHFTLLENSSIKLFLGKKALEFSNFVEKKVGNIDHSQSEFKGQPTYPGLVRGKVFIALMAREASKMKKGMVLVTSMTTPDYVSAMKRSLAIVTNEGGLLSHAAIISRELQKPCIVGTKIATKLLKNGDMVEVDANKGIVKKL